LGLFLIQRVKKMLIDFIQLEFIDLKLRKLCQWLEDETGLCFTNTSLYRMDSEGVHGVLPLRGIDLRMRSQIIGEAIVRWINANWIYDPARPSIMCAIIHGKGSSLHIHLQTHPNTTKRVQA